MPKPKYIWSKCNICGEEMVSDKFDNLICPGGCGGYYQNVESPKEQYKVILECARNDQVSKPVIHTKSHGSGSKSKKGKDQKMSKPTTKQLYDSLSSGSNKIIYRKDLDNDLTK